MSDRKLRRRTYRLTQTMIDGIDEVVEKGRFATPSEAVRHSINLMFKELKGEGVLAS